MAFAWTTYRSRIEGESSLSRKRTLPLGCRCTCWTEILHRHYLSSELSSDCPKIKVSKSRVWCWCIFMVVYKLEMIIFPGIIYFEGKRVIMTKEKCHVWHCPSRRRRRGDSGCFQSLSAHGGNERRRCSGTRGRDCSLHRSSGLGNLSAKRHFCAASISNKFEFVIHTFD